MISMTTSGDLKKDFERFFETLIEKYNIQDKEAFAKEFFDYLDENVKPEYENPKVFEKVITENPDEMKKITKKFFSLIEKYSAGFDFYEGATTEIENIKKLQGK